MASLTGQTIADTYHRLLTIDSDNFTADAAAKYIKDGDAGTASALSLSTNRVGIGTAAPENELHILGSTAIAQLEWTAASSTVSGGVLILACDDNAALADTHRLGAIEFRGSESSGDTLSLGAWIGAVADEAWSGSDNSTALVFHTESLSGAIAEKMRIDQNGYVGIGEAAPAAKLEVNTVAADGATAPVLFAIRDTTDNKSDANSSFFFQDKDSGAGEGIGVFGISIGSDTNKEGNLLRVDQRGNVGIRTTTLDSSVVGYLAIANGTSPGAHTDGQVYIGSKDSSVGSANSTLSFFCEQAVETSAPTIAHKMRVWINDTEYWIGLDPV